MVQEYVSPVRVHKYPFEMVMAAYERRFPSCPQIPVVVDCAITDDSWSSDDSQRHTTRRCQLNVEAPYLLKKMIGVDYIYFIQKNHLDLKGRVLEIEATNETFAARVGVVEKCRYFVHPENSEWTCFEQSALLDVKNFFGLESTVEKIAMKQYAANIAKGKELIESFMQEVHADGVKELRPWDFNDPEYNRELRRVVSRGTEPLSPRGAADLRNHSQPGTSENRGLKTISKSSHLALKPSKGGLANRDSSNTSRVNITRSKVALKPSMTQLSNALKKSSHLFQRIRAQKSQERFAADRPLTECDSPPPTAKKSSIIKSFSRSKLNLNKQGFSKDQEHKEFRELKKKVTMSHPNLTLRKNSSEDLLVPMMNQPMFKSCDCPSQTDSPSVAVSRCDSLLVVLVCAMMVMLLVSGPVSFLFNYNRRR